RVPRLRFPSLFNVERACIAFKNQTLIFQVVETRTLTVRRGELRPTAEVDCSCHFSISSSIDYRAAVAPAVESENARSSGIVDDGVRLFPGRYLADSLERLQIENRNR